MDILDLSDFFKTKAESVNFLSHLTNISEKIYTTGFDLEKTLAEEIGLKKKEKFIALLINNKVNIGSQSEMSSFFNKMIEKISNLSVLTITLAFEPTEKTLEALSEWFFINTKKQFLYEFKVNPELIGGAEILANGKHANFSIREKFDEVLKNTLQERANNSGSYRNNSNSGDSDKSVGEDNASNKTI